MMIESERNYDQERGKEYGMVEEAPCPRGDNQKTGDSRRIFAAKLEGGGCFVLTPEIICNPKGRVLKTSKNSNQSRQRDRGGEVQWVYFDVEAVRQQHAKQAIKVGRQFTGRGNELCSSSRHSIGRGEGAGEEDGEKM